MSRKFVKGDPLFEDMREGLENLRSRLIDLEAAAHAAADTTDQIPFLPRLPRHGRGETKPAWTEEDRRNLGRMQSYVVCTATAAEAALDEVSVLIDDLDRGGDDDDSGNGADSSGSGGGRKASAKAGTREASAVPEAVDPETTKPYRIPRKTTGNHPVPPSRSGGIILDLPTP